MSNGGKCMQTTKNGYLIWNSSNCVTKIDAKPTRPYDAIFLKKIKEFNKTNKQGSNVVIQVSETEAIHVYWLKGRWTYDVLPFIRAESSV